MSQRAKLTAGNNWTAFLGGQRSRSVPLNPDTLDAATDAEVLKVLNTRIAAHRAAMKKKDQRRATSGINDTVWMLKRARQQPGHAERQAALTKVVKWLTAQPDP